MSDNFDSTFEKMISEFKSLQDLKKFTEAQHKTIIEMGKKIKELEDANRKLKISTVVQQEQPIQQQSTISLDTSMSDEEMICTVQLQLLKEKSNDNELTLEEAKKVDMYHKILSNLREKNKTKELPLINLSDDDLLKLVQEGTNE